MNIMSHDFFNNRTKFEANVTEDVSGNFREKSLCSPIICISNEGDIKSVHFVSPSEQLEPSTSSTGQVFSLQLTSTRDLRRGRGHQM